MPRGDMKNDGLRFAYDRDDEEEGRLRRQDWIR